MMSNTENRENSMQAMTLSFALVQYYQPGMTTDDMLAYMHTFTNDEWIILKASIVWMTIVQDVQRQEKQAEERANHAQRV